MKFRIQSDKFIGFFRTPGTVQVGDTIYADSRKYTENGKYLGPSYAQYSVVDSVPLGQLRFRVKAMSNRVLDFLSDGIVTVSGMSDQIFTLNETTNQIVDSQVLNNTLTITGGSNKFVDSCGSYEVQTVGNGGHIGTLKQKCAKKFGLLHFIFSILSIVAVMVIVYKMYRKLQK